MIVRCFLTSNCGDKRFEHKAFPSVESKMNNIRNSESKILIVDDEESNVLFLETLLEEAGLHNVYSITDPREASAWFRKLQPDIILLDLSMHFLSGFEVMEQLENEFPGHQYRFWCSPQTRLRPQSIVR